jgi:hypothetical protein
MIAFQVDKMELPKFGSDGVTRPTWSMLQSLIEIRDAQ